MKKRAEILTSMGVFFCMLILIGWVAAASNNLVINEIDYDQPGSDTAEFLEIKNTGVSSVNLDPYTVKLVNGAGGGAVVYQTINLPDVDLAPGDYYVVCADAGTVINCDLDIINSIQNGAPDAAALKLGSSIVDTVSYEGSTVAPYTEGSGVGIVDYGTSGHEFEGISRFPDGSDSDRNNVDLSRRCITPGEANAASNSDCPTPTTTTSTTTTSTSTSTSTTTTLTQPPQSEIPEYPTAALPVGIAAMGYLILQKRRRKF